MKKTDELLSPEMITRAGSRKMLRNRQSKYLVGAATAFIMLGTAIPAHAYKPSASDCAAEAERAARGGHTVVGSAAVGATGGAVFGGIVGGRKGARRGAAAGAVVGGASSGYRKNDVYKRVYDDCMYRRY